MIRPKQVINKQQIISEYLSSTLTYKELEQRYGVPARTIQTWVRAFRVKHPSLSDPKAPDAVQLGLLQQQLDQLLLKNQLLQHMLELAEQHTGIDITKKYGTKQS